LVLPVSPQLELFRVKSGKKIINKVREMKKALLLLCCALALPAVAQADVSVDINVPGVSLHLGDRDDRGNYWDGYDWRPPQWWNEHHNQHIGDRNDRGMYWNGGGWQQHAPVHQQPQPKHNQGRGDKAPSPQGNGNHHGDVHQSSNGGNPSGQHNNNQQNNNQQNNNRQNNNQHNSQQNHSQQNGGQGGNGQPIPPQSGNNQGH
jgi:hypothetical protein